MRKYRSKPPLAAKRLRSDDAWFDDINLMDRSLTVYETEAEWQAIGILGPDGEPIEALVGGLAHRIGFLPEYEEIEDE